MIVLNGKGVYGRIAIGKISVANKKKMRIKRVHVEDKDAEIARFEAAKMTAINELDQLYAEAVREVGEANAAIFSIHKMMIEDEDFCDSVRNIIKNEGVNADYAVMVTGDNFSEMFSAMNDAYMKERANDVHDIADRLTEVMRGTREKDDVRENVIIAAEDLMPSETVQMDKEKVLAFITTRGSVNSHTAILARTMSIPAIVGIGTDLTEYDGRDAVVDGFSGNVYIDPDKITLEKMREKKRQDEENRRLLENLKGMESVTMNGRRVNVYANIGGLADVAEVLKNDADGVGLFRSEFLYLEKKECPSENEQFAVYKKVVQNMAGKKVIIRTLDIGADKQVEYLNSDKEENPALGYRAVRICLDREDIFKTQLRAIYRASAFGEVAVMVPMIVSVSEVREVKRIIAEVKQELKADRLSFDEETEFGIMIETPAAALISDVLAREVDFFSLGTNDLVQYTLAADRQNPRLDRVCNPYHRAVLELIEVTVKNAHAAGIWAGICGEIAADTNLTDFFLAIGVDELSVTPGNVLGVRKKIRETDVTAITERFPSVTVL